MLIRFQYLEGGRWKAQIKASHHEVYHDVRYHAESNSYSLDRGRIVVFEEPPKPDAIGPIARSLIKE